MIICNLFEQYCVKNPKKIAYKFISKTSEESITYEALHRAVVRCANQLNAHVAQGERAVILLNPGIDYIIAFLSCLYAGIVAVPAYPPRNSRHKIRLQYIIDDADAKLVISDALVLDKYVFAQRGYVMDRQNLDLENECIPQKAQVAPQDIAFLQYTSGSTGNPKGVMVSHKNIAANCDAMVQAYAYHQDSKICSWLPPYHDMGLINAILCPVYAGFSSVLMSPNTFFIDPTFWFEILSREKATFTAAPNFAYQLVAEKCQDAPDILEKLDLSSLSIAVNGAEPIHAETIALFNAVFRAANLGNKVLTPAYGMAETTLMITTENKSSNHKVLTLSQNALEINKAVMLEQDAQGLQAISCGQSQPLHDLIIVDPDKVCVLRPYEVGEIWVSGPSVTCGYWQQPELTASVFNAHTSDNQGPYLRTGDLGFIDTENNLYVTGRMKDVLIIHGRNLYPQDIENVVASSHEGLIAHGAAVFATDKSQVVIVAEIKRHSKKFNDMTESILRHVIAAFDVIPYQVVFIQQASLPKTSSGKVQRRATKTLLQNDRLKIIHQWQQHHFGEVQSDLRQWALPKTLPQNDADIHHALKGCIATLLSTNVDAVEDNASFFDHGFDSIKSIVLMEKLSSWLQISINPTILWEKSTVDQLSQYLAQELGLETTKHHATVQDAPSPGKHTNDIAVIGMACRFPQGENVEAFWQLLAQGQSAVTPLPINRYQDKALNQKYVMDPQMSAIHGGFLTEIDAFDAAFFGISSLEAEMLDPQQSILLETAWHAFEHAGIVPSSLRGSSTGVFVGVTNHDYDVLLHKSGNPHNLNPYVATGNSHSAAAGRLSYVFGLQGPSQSIDTACSSSLVAVHNAIQAIQLGECDLALAAGVNVLLNSDAYTILSRAHMLSPEGKCKTFDADADGYVRGEGCNVILLKRLDRAIAAGDHVLAVIDGSVMNQDGESNGFTAPNVDAQVALYDGVLKKSDTNIGDVDFIETHGTGTKLGDPIEVRSLQKVYGAEPTRTHPIYLGAVKTNIGHLEAAAGLAGMMKIILSLQNELWPKNIHFHQQNPYLELGHNLALANEPIPWKVGDKRRIAALSSFGFTGTNVHMLVKEPAVHGKPLQQQSALPEQPLLFCVSAKTQCSLLAQLHTLSDFLRRDRLDSNGLMALSLTLNQRREHFDKRVALLATTCDQLINALDLAAGVLKEADLSSPVLSVQMHQVDSEHITVLYPVCEQGGSPIATEQDLQQVMAESPLSLLALARCYVSGLKIAWDCVFRHGPQQFLSNVPGYCFDRHSYWFDEAQNAQASVTVAHVEADSQHIPLERWFYEPSEERIKTRLSNASDVIQSPVFHEVKAALEDWLSQQTFADIQAEYPLYEKLNALSLRYVVEAFSALELDLDHQDQVVQEHNKLFIHLHQVVKNAEAQGVLTTLPTARALAEELEAAYPENVLLGLVMQCGKALSEVLCGELDSLRLLFPNHGTAYSAESLYKEASFAQANHALTTQLVVEAIEKIDKPCVRILEIGAGTGGTTRGILQQLDPNKVSYTFTDVSQAFLEKAQQQFAAYSFLDYRILDLEQEPFSQGFASTFDIVIAANVVHATVDLKQSLKHIRQCLTPHGILILQEGLTQQLWLDITFGLVNGWWRFNDDIRNYPLVDEQTWQHCLLASGFTNADIFQVDNITGQVNIFAQAASAMPEDNKETWLVIGEQSHFDAQYAKLYCVTHSNGSTQIQDDGYQMDLTDRQAWVAFHEHVVAEQKHFDRVLFVLPLTQQLNSDETAKVMAYQKLCCSALLHVTQVFDASLEQGIPFYLMVSGAQALSSQPCVGQTVLPEMSTLPAMLDSLKNEKQHFNLHVIDIDPTTDQNNQFCHIVQGMACSHQYSHVLLREGEIYAPILQQKQVPQEEIEQFFTSNDHGTFSIKTNKVYVITGGLGGLGKKVATALAKIGVNHIVLLGRSAPHADDQHWMHAFKQQGVHMQSFSVDISDAVKLAEVFSDIEKINPIGGVIHAAGVLSDHLWANQTWAHFDAVFCPKIQGLLNLHHLTKSMPLAHFIVFSSVASQLKPAGQSNHVAANAFLDSFMSYRVTNGLPALSINWGIWSDVGYAARAGVDQKSSWGVHSITPDAGVNAFKWAMHAALQHITIAPIDWPTYFSLQRVSLDYLRAFRLPVRGATRQDDAQGMALALVKERVKALLANILNKDPQQLSDDQGFFEMGLDSLLTIAFQNKLEQAFQQKLSSTFIFEHTNITEVALALSNGTSGRMAAQNVITRDKVSSEPIAIVGVACRFPGGADTPERFWQNLCDGIDAVVTVPNDRVYFQHFYPEGSPHTLLKKGGFLSEAIDTFDPQFFNLSPKEAEMLDPQQRLLLEVTYEAIESSMTLPEDLKGSNTGVFVGISTNDYQILLNKHLSPDELNFYMSSGNATSTASGRLSYTFGLEGPCISIDTACSSSLVALDSAIEKLNSHACDAAIVGGVNLMLTPEHTANLQKANMLSPNGVCSAFDKAANGFVRGEGCGVVILKPLSQAQSAGNPIWGIIEASGINQDGASSGLTVPNGQAQTRLMQSVLNKSGLQPHDIDYIEAHGTGTELGDPIEINAINRVYDVEGRSRHPLKVGSVKTNIGHLEAAAGMAGLIKVLLSFRYGEIPANLHFHEKNPKIDLNGVPIEIVAQHQAWQRDDQHTRRAGISSFGFSGTNAHVILREPDVPDIHAAAFPKMPAQLFCFSAKNHDALLYLLSNMLRFLSTTEVAEVPLDSLSYTLNVKRTQYACRASVVAKDHKQLQQTLQSLIDQYSENNNGEMSRQEIAHADALVQSFQNLDDGHKTLTALGQYFVKGYNIDWSYLYGDIQYPTVQGVPGYVFHKETFWFPRPTENHYMPVVTESVLLGKKIESPLGGNLTFYNELSLSGATSYLRDHKIFNAVLFPGAGYIELTLQALQTPYADKHNNLVDVQFLQPLVISCEEVLKTQLILEYDSAPTKVLFYANNNKNWECYFSAHIGENRSKPLPTLSRSKYGNKNCHDIEGFYQQFDQLGLHYGPAFQTLHAVYQHENAVLGYAETTAVLEGHQRIHPSLLDGCFHVLSYLLEDSDTILLPFAIERIDILQNVGNKAVVEAVIVTSDASAFTADITIYNASGEPCIKLNGFTARKLNKLHFYDMGEQHALDALRYQIEWQSAQNIEPKVSKQRLCVQGLDQPYLSALQQAGYELMAQSDVKQLEDVDAVVIKLAVSDYAEPDLPEIVMAHCQEILTWVQQLVALENPPSFYVLTSKGVYVEQDDELYLPHAGVSGFMKTLRLESPRLHAFHIDISVDTSAELFVKELALQHGNENQVALREERRLIPRLLPASKVKHRRIPVPNDAFYLLAPTERGEIDSLALLPQEKPVLQDDQIGVEVSAAGLNFRDVLNAMDLYPGDPGPLGGEFAGKVTEVGKAVKNIHIGDTVCGFGAGAFANKVVTIPDLVAIVPECMSCVEASTIPIVFLTCYFSLCVKAKITKSDKILIHSAAGGVGLAAIQFAQNTGCEIFVSAGSAKKRQYLASLGIPETHIFDSRHDEYGKHIQVLTQGSGVDVVLNYLTGDAIDKTLDVVAKNGRFIELGKRDIYSVEEMESARPDIDYHIVALDDVMRDEPKVIKRLFDGVMPLFDQGVLHSLPITTFTYAESITAFHFMQKARHIGKISLVPPKQSIQIDTAGAYWVTGGLGGIGLAVVEWLAEEGANTIIVSARHKPKHAQAQVLQRLIKQYPNSAIQVQILDVSDTKQVEDFLQQSKEQDLPLKGIFHLAGVVDDRLITKQNCDSFVKVFLPKVHGAWNIIQAINQHLQSLDFLMLFSSIASSIGSPGQINYACANSFLDSLAYCNTSPFTLVSSINWGVWAGAGMAVDLVNQHQAKGIQPLSPKRALSACYEILREGEHNTTILDMDWDKWSSEVKPPLLANMMSPEQNVDLWAQVVSAPEHLKVSVLQGQLQKIIANAVGVVDVNRLDIHMPFSELGIDSLLAADINQRLNKYYGSVVALSLAKMMALKTIEALSHFIIESSCMRVEDDTSAQDTILWVFTGQGSLVLEGINRLYKHNQVFQRAFDRYIAIASDITACPLKTYLIDPQDHRHALEVLKKTQYQQPVLVSLQLAQIELLSQQGIQPQIVLGHSIGEISAAVAAGILAAEDALHLACSRGEHMSQAPTGMMAVVRASAADLQDKLPPELNIAAYNAPNITVISGDPKSMETAFASLKGYAYQVLPVSHGFHSSLMYECAKAFEQALNPACFHEPNNIMFLSSLTAQVESSALMRPEYWSKQIIEPVQFYPAIARLFAHDQYPNVIYELGPASTLITLVNQTIPAHLLDRVRQYSIADYSCSIIR